MKNEHPFKKILTLAIMLSAFYFVMKYQDTDSFQNAMKFLIDPDADMALPLFWQNNRMLFFGIAILIVLYYYKPVWLTYRSLIGVYRKGSEQQKEPDVSVLQGSYFYQQDKTVSLMTFLIDLCRRGVLILSYAGRKQLWSISRVSGTMEGKMESSEIEIVDKLFQNRKKIKMKASLSDPDPDVRQAAEELFKKLKEDNRQFSREKKSLMPVVVFFLAVSAELPFYIASQSSQMPAVFFITLVSAVLAAIPAYVFYKDFPAYFNEPELPVFIKLFIAFVVVLISLLYIFSNRHGIAPYWSIALYPDLAAVIMVSVYTVPMLPKDHHLLQQIIGYRRFLYYHDYPIKEENLLWSLALGLHTGFIKNTFVYEEETVPEWIHLEDSEEEIGVQKLMKRLYQALPVQISQAVNGEVRFNNSTSNRDVSKRF